MLSPATAGQLTAIDLEVNHIYSAYEAGPECFIDRPLARGLQRPHGSLDDRTPAEFARLFADRPFTLSIVNKAGPAARQGFAAAGQENRP